MSFTHGPDAPAMGLALAKASRWLWVNRCRVSEWFAWLRFLLLEHKLEDGPITLVSIRYRADTLERLAFLNGRLRIDDQRAEIVVRFDDPQSEPIDIKGWDVDYQ